MGEPWAKRAANASRAVRVSGGGLSRVCGREPASAPAAAPVGSEKGDDGEVVVFKEENEDEDDACRGGNCDC